MPHSTQSLPRKEVIAIVAESLTDATERGYVPPSARAKPRNQPDIHIPAEADFALDATVRDTVNLVDALLDVEEALQDLGINISLGQKDIQRDGDFPQTVGEFADRVIARLEKEGVEVTEKLNVRTDKKVAGGISNKHQAREQSRPKNVRARQRGR